MLLNDKRIFLIGFMLREKKRDRESASKRKREKFMEKKGVDSREEREKKEVF